MLLEDRKLRQYHNQGRVHLRTGGPSIFTGPSRSKASVSRGGNKELDINEAISGQRHMRKNIHRTSLSFANSTSQMTRSEYDAQLKFADLNEETLIKTLGTHKSVAQAENDTTAPNGIGTTKLDRTSFRSTENLLRRLSDTQSINAKTSQTGAKPIYNKIYPTIDKKALLETAAFVYDFHTPPTGFVRTIAINHDESMDNGQKDDGAVTQDQRLTDTSLKLNPTLHTADHSTAVDQPHNKRNSVRRFWDRRRSRPNLDPIQQTQASNAPTGNPNPMSFDQLNSTHLRQRYQASLSNISAVQGYGRRGVQMGIRKEKTFEELSNVFSTSGHYTISQDHTAGEQTRRSHLLANFGRRCGANTNEEKQLKVADDELNPPAINMVSVSGFARRDDLKPQDTGGYWKAARMIPWPSGNTFRRVSTSPDG
ncbi:Ff.00g042270.m01.CDS01 [Fusarium sp. VM40]|nr:Ff.00g042270.m01.CDS01 [Fusarium sp. VM40]